MKLTGNTILRSPDGELVVLYAGDELPAWAKVGDHLLDKPKARPAKK